MLVKSICLACVLNAQTRLLQNERTSGTHFHGIWQSDDRASRPREQVLHTVFFCPVSRLTFANFFVVSACSGC